MAFAAFAAALLALWLRRRPGDSGLRPEGAPATPSAAAAPGTGGGPAGTTESGRRAGGSGETEMHGLRLLEQDEALRRGWAEPREPGGGPTERQLAAQNKWAETLVTTNFDDADVGEILTDLRARYGLDIRLDPGLDPAKYRTTFMVREIDASQAFGLILRMLDLKSGLDAEGVMWVATEERLPLLCGAVKPALPEEVAGTTARVRALSGWSPDAPRDRSPGTWLQDKWGEVNIVRQPLRDAVESLAKSCGYRIKEWSRRSEREVEGKLPVSVVGEHVSLRDSLVELLEGAGLALQVDSSGSFEIETAEEHGWWLERVRNYAAFENEAHKAKEGLRDRPVRIRGACMTLRDVTAQVSEQLRVPVVLAPGVEPCREVWESDGLEQDAKTVLDILARDARLCWQFMRPLDALGDPEGEPAIWLVPREAAGSEGGSEVK